MAQPDSSGDLVESLTIALIVKLYPLRSQPLVFNQFHLLPRDEAWIKFADDFTTVIKRLIEFAKRVDIFMVLDREDKIRIFKEKIFEMAVIALSYGHCPPSFTPSVDNAVTPASDEEVQFVNEVGKREEKSFQMNACLDQLSSLGFARAELALLLTQVLVDDSVVDSAIDRMRRAMIARLADRLGDSLGAMSVLVNVKAKIREVSELHMVLLEKLREELPDVTAALPPLYQEVFRRDY